MRRPNCRKNRRKLATQSLRNISIMHGNLRILEGVFKMEATTFEQIKTKFRQADTETKISIYVTTENLTQAQYTELLRLFPLHEIGRLEAALG